VYYGVLRWCVGRTGYLRGTYLGVKERENVAHCAPRSPKKEEGMWHIVLPEAKSGKKNVAHCAPRG